MTATSAWGGAEVQTLALAEELVRRDHKISIVELGHDIYTRKGTRFTNGIEVVQKTFGKTVENLSLCEATKLFHTLQPDAIIFQKGELDSANWQFDLGARLASPRYIAIENWICEPMPAKSTRRHLGGLVRGFGLWWYRTYLRRWSRGLAPHAIVCVSEAVRERLINEYHFPSAKTVTIHNGVNPFRFHRSIEARGRVREAWKLPAAGFVFGAVGRLAPEKGYDLAIEAFAKLLQVLPDKNLWLVLVGDGPMRENLQSKAADLCISDRIRFPGFTNRPWESYSALDIFVMPSVTESLGLSLLEAMACECCPIATNVGGIPEILNDHRLGWLVRGRDDLLKAMIEAATSNSSKLASMRQLGRERVKAYFDSNAQLTRLANLIEGRAEVDRMTPVSCAQDHPEPQKSALV